MEKEKIIKLNIGDDLFAYVAFKGIFNYKVIGIREYQSGNLYEIECQQCHDHENCIVLVSQHDNFPQFQYVSMVNEDEENEQYYWHSGQDYFISKNECKKQAYDKSIKSKKKEIEELENKLKERKQSLSELQSLVEVLIQNKQQ